MKRFICVMVVIGCFIAGCDLLPVGYTEIKDILQNPAQFEGKEIKVKGVVAEVFKIPFVEIKMYSLKDGGSEIIVITNGTLPGTNQHVKIIALVDSTMIIGKESIGVKLKEIKRL